MTISMHSASAPILLQQLGAMLGWLDKAEAHAQARKFDTAVYLGQRLAPDMLPFASQIRIASDAAKGCVARLAGQEPPKFEDNEATLDDLRQRIRKTIDYVKSVPAEAIDGSEERDITIPMRTREAYRFKGEYFLKHWALPNFFFHCTMAYALLRHNGVELGKPDFLVVS
ncbi:DUF1993 family protein [Ideonella sp. A 288]|uniref:DUF1993 domain-containing protein n=1 Tax=Ideonella sp. A 288 TaxID=1962181 RepID=UPI000B4B53FD|nr:DUF1993 domain-containing protein [Ideonella sp. A 288]